MENVDKKRDVKEEEEEKQLKTCPHCGKEVPEKNNKFKARKFCSVVCNRRFFSLKRYHKIKDTEEYKTYRKGYYKGWLDKNRDKFNASMRKASLKYQQKKKKEREDQKQNENQIHKEVENVL